MTALVSEESAWEVASTLLPERDLAYPEGDLLGSMAEMFMASVERGEVALASRISALADLFWRYGDEDVRADVVGGFACHIADSTRDRHEDVDLFDALTSELIRLVQEAR